MAEAAYDGWKNDMLAGKVTLMAASGTAEVTELSARARADRVTAGQVEADGVRLRDGNLAGAGDWIVTRLNDRRMSLFSGRDWVKNGDAWQVVRRLEDESLRVRHLGHGGLLTLPASYVHGEVQLLYATTAHRAQGTTVDTAHPLITEGMSREALYVLATRAREHTTLYVATHDIPFDDDARVNQVRSDPRAWAAREILLNILGTETAPLPASETITTAQDEALSLAALVPRYLHAARLDADARYRSAATVALGKRLGHELASDAAWGAVVRRLFDAEGDGWEPARLLATIARSRELGSADSIAEVLSWRIDAFLSGNQGCRPPAAAVPESFPVRGDITAGSGCAAYETSAQASKRLGALAVATLSAPFADRARAEAAWPALIAALRRAENAGYSPADALIQVATARELRTARSVSEVLAWRINRHIADSETRHAQAGTVPAPGSSAAALLPWVPSPRQVPADAQAGPLTAYLREAADLISTRIQTLTDTAVRLRQPWTGALGYPPDDPGRVRDWLRHVAVVAAYRDHYKITSDDPGQVLGPYAEPGHAGHNAYWHAAESVLAARQLAGLEAASSNLPDSQARAQVAADVYRGLSDAERAAVAGLVAAAPEAVWFGAANSADEHAAVQRAHARQLADVLTRRGYLTDGSALPQRPPGTGTEPVEAELARRGRRGHARVARAERTGRETGSWAADRTQQQVPRPTIAPAGPAPVR